MKLLSVFFIMLASLMFAACSDLGDTSSSSSGSSSTSSGGSVLSYGGYPYNYSCPYSGAASVTIPPTSSSFCATIYERMASEIGCNDFTQSTYDYIISNYYTCLSQDSAACASASSTDPNCN